MFEKPTLETIKKWRKQEYDAGRPCGFRDFFVVNNICSMCRGCGKTFQHKMIGGIWHPTETLETCERCGGDGKYKNI